ncbi:TPA: hypothetical protein R1765_001981 [Campylobacter coli]|nr:hypothetical protein [Campylobacter coli]
MNLFNNPTYNNSFLGSSSAKPIAGICTKTAYSRPLTQGKITENFIAVGYPVKITNKISDNQNSSVNAGTGLAPNVLNVAKATDSVDGFTVMAPNVVLEDGDNFPKYLKNQIAQIAILGSGAEIYLPANNNLIGLQVAKEQLCWNVADKKVEQGIGDGSSKLSLGVVTILSQVVDGIYSYVDDEGVCKTEETPVIKIKL